MPTDAPEITRKECVAAGGELYLVDGLIGDAGKIVAQAVEDYELFDASTLKKPYRIEGKIDDGFRNCRTVWLGSA